VHSVHSTAGLFSQVKKLPASEFVEMVAQSTEKLLEHLHTLSQESLDHADLTVLTATLGAAALTKNALFCFNETLKKQEKRCALIYSRAFILILLLACDQRKKYL
jgi:Domain of unknown function (DUF4495)